MMSIAELGALGEFLSSLGVLITLVYLAVQLRQNTKAIRAGTTQSVIQMTSDFHRVMSEDLERNEKIFAIATSDPRSRSEAEETLYRGFVLQPIRAQEAIYYQRKLGTVDPEFVALDKRIQFALAPGSIYRRAWDEGLVQRALSDEYVGYVDQVIHRADSR